MKKKDSKLMLQLLPEKNTTQSNKLSHKLTETENSTTVMLICLIAVKPKMTTNSFNQPSKEIKSPN